MNLIENSLAIALKAHAGQQDKAGRTYILHPLRVMQKMESEVEMAAAILHDVLEDSLFTVEDLRNEGIPEDVVQALLLLTKKEGESYMDFIARVSTNKLATAVKLADLEDNMNILRLADISEKDLERLAKYHEAYRTLNR